MYRRAAMRQTVAMRPGTTIVLAALLVMILGAAAIQFLLAVH